MIDDCSSHATNHGKQGRHVRCPRTGRTDLRICRVVHPRRLHSLDQSLLCPDLSHYPAGGTHPLGQTSRCRGRAMRIYQFAFANHHHSTRPDQYTVWRMVPLKGRLDGKVMGTCPSGSIHINHTNIQWMESFWYQSDALYHRTWWFSLNSLPQSHRKAYGRTLGCSWLFYSYRSLKKS